MTVSWSEIWTALLWSAIGAVGVWLLTWPIRRRSTSWLLLSLTLTCAAASAGAMLGAVHSMLLPMGDETAVLVLAGVAGGLTAVAAVLAARRLGRDHGAVQRAVDELTHGLIPDTSGPRLSRELQNLRTDLHRSSVALHESRDRERALDASRRELVAWVSHDLRTPLAGLRAMAEALEDGVADDPDTYYKQIGASVTRLSDMVDDLFNLSRIQAGALGNLDDLQSLQDIVSDVVASLVPLAAARGATLEYVPSDGAGDVAVRGNAAELTRAVTNVVANAIRRTAEDEPVVVGLRVIDGCARIDVADGCGGIADEVISRLFDVGYRASQSRDANDGGAGLGLPIARGIVEAHGGDVCVENTARGCRFSLTVPLA